jgi:hypothetical protein
VATADSSLGNAFELQFKLDRLFRFLEREEIFISVAEQSDAFAILEVSRDAPLPVLKRRLRATILKDTEFRQARIYNSAFDAAFSGTDVLVLNQPAPEQSQGRRFEPVKRDTVEVQQPDARSIAPGTTLLLTAVVLLVGALTTVYWETISQFFTSTDKTTVIVTTDRKDGEGNQGTDVLDSGNNTNQQPSDSNQGGGRNDTPPTQQLVQITSILLAAADTNRKLHLNRVADVFEDQLPIGMTRAQFLHQLMRRTAADPTRLFRLNELSLTKLGLAIYYLVHEPLPLRGDEPEVLAEIGIRLTDVPQEFSGPEEDGVAQQIEGVQALLNSNAEVESAEPSPWDAVKAEINTDQDLAAAILIIRDAALLQSVSQELGLDGSSTWEQLLPVVVRTMQRVENPYSDPTAKPTSGVFASWLVYLSAVLAPIVIIGWRFSTHNRRLGAWFTRNPPPLGFAPKYNVWGGLTQAVDDAMGRDLRIRAARNLARPILRETKRLDPRATATATARNMGRFKPVYAMSRITPSYLLIISRQSADDHQAQQFRELTGSLAQIGSSLDIWYMDHDGDTLFRDPNTMADIRSHDSTGFHDSYNEDRIDLETLWRMQPDRRVIVLGNGDAFLSPATGDPRACAMDLQRWPYFALMTPRPTRNWGRRETLLAKIFEGRIFEARPEGLRELSLNAGQSQSAELHEYTPEGSYIWEQSPDLLTSEFRPSDELLTILHRDLRRALGNGGMLWLRAATVYPTFNWDLTIYLGKFLTDPDQTHTSDTETNTVYTPDRFRALAALPWFREARFPLWAVLWLQEGMSPEHLLFVRDLLLGRLPDAHLQPDSALNEALFLTEGTGAEARTIDQGHRQVFLELLANQPPKGKQMKANEEIAEKYAASRSRFRRRESMVIGALLGFSLTAAILVPWPNAQTPLFAGDYLPLFILLVLASVFYPLIHFGVHAFPLRSDAEVDA